MFTPFDMYKDASLFPDSPSFDKVYESGGVPVMPPVTIKAWRMLQSSATQEPIMLQFAIPDVPSPLSFFEVELHVLIERGNEIGVFRIGVRGDFVADLTDIGPVFDFSVSTSDIVVVEPAVADNLKHIVVSILVPTGTIDTKDWGLLVFERVRPSGDEYVPNVFLSSVILRYPVG